MGRTQLFLSTAPGVVSTELYYFHVAKLFSLSISNVMSCENNSSIGVLIEQLCKHLAATSCRIIVALRFRIWWLLDGDAMSYMVLKNHCSIPFHSLWQDNNKTLLIHHQIWICCTGVYKHYNETNTLISQMMHLRDLTSSSHFLSLRSHT